MSRACPNSLIQFTVTLQQSLCGGQSERVVWKLPGSVLKSEKVCLALVTFAILINHSLQPISYNLLVMTNRFRIINRCLPVVNKLHHTIMSIVSDY